MTAIARQDLDKGYTMRKENVLVAVLVAMAVAGILMFNFSKESEPVTEAAVPLAEKTLQGTLPETQPGKETEGIGWQGYTPGLAMAGNQSKPVFLYFHADWCTYCKKLKQTTFKDKKVRAYLEENFISIQVDTEKNKPLAEEWRVKGLPTLWFLEPDGTRISSLPGYIDAAQFLQILKFIHTRSYETMDFQEFIKQG